jgi:hypothetical protein
MENHNMHEEWYFQSDYDLETAVDMLNNKAKKKPTLRK